MGFFSLGSGLAFDGATLKHVMTAGAGLNLSGAEFSFNTAYGDARYYTQTALDALLTGYLLLSGGMLTGDLNMADNKYIKLGSDADGWLGHNGTDVTLLNYSPRFVVYHRNAADTGWESGFTSEKQGACRLLYSNSQKLATTSDGTTTTGRATIWQNSTSQSALLATCPNTSFAETVIRGDAYRAGSSAFSLMTLRSDLDSTANVRFRVTGEGEVYGDGATYNSNADAAEMFEWLDGNPANEDRAGMSVVLVGDKIRLATDDDDPCAIFGIISAMPHVVGNAAPLNR